MLATMTGLAQVTEPKEPRDRLCLDAGRLLDVEIPADNTIRVHAVKPEPQRIRGLQKIASCRRIGGGASGCGRRRISAAQAHGPPVIGIAATNVSVRLWLGPHPAHSCRIDVLLGAHWQAAGSLLVIDVVLAVAAALALWERST